MRAILFDIDLTLLQTGGVGLRSLSLALEDICGDPSICEGITFAGKTDPMIFLEIADRLGPDGPNMEEFSRELEARYLDHLERELKRSEGFKLCPGVPAVLEAAKERGLVLGLCTGNLKRGAILKLERGGLAGYFRFGGFGEDGPTRESVARAAVERALERIEGGAGSTDIWIVGDTPRDVAAAKAAGAKALAVATGYHEVGELESCGADLAVPDLAVGDLLDRLDGFG